MNRRSLFKLLLAPLVAPILSRWNRQRSYTALTPSGPVVLEENMRIDIHPVEEFHGTVDLRQHGPFDFATESRVRYVEAQHEAARNLHKMLKGLYP